MAQLVLTAATTAATSAARTGLTAFLARTVATTAASFAAGYASRLIFGPAKRRVEGPRLESFTVQASQEGAPVPRVYGRARIAGQLIWAANFKESVSETTESTGGKGGRPSAQTTFTEYLYSISFAVGLCEGAIDRVARVWADGKPFDISAHNVRIYRGDGVQQPDALIESIEGAGAAPAFRGLAYIVLEDLPLKDFGNRIPQLSFEIEKSLRNEDPAALENTLTAVTMIPGSGEFVYGKTKVLREVEEGVTRAENVHNTSGATDFTAALDALIETAPNLKHVSLVVSWFGDSTDLGACTLRPGVEIAEKETTPYPWRAGGVGRDGAHLVSLLDGAPAYGGTPADRAVIEAIAALKAWGISVMFHPFILMDAPGFPWRGRIDAGTDDQTAAAGAAMASFFGTAGPSDFLNSSGEVDYAGPAEWSFRRMILHYAHLCALAGGVDAFLLGSELRGVTTTRDGAGAYPAVAALKTLAADVRSVLGGETEISYAADWSEYFGHQPADGSGDVFFHLDDLWADSHIDFIGIDNYMPLADWRDGFGHADALAGAAGPYDRAYLQSNIRGGEGYDWFYISPADREAQTRTPIADGTYGEDWVFRYKDLWNWWANPHHDRPGGVRDASPTAWFPQSKPIVFTETGCPAVDKGANQPNVFVDAKSSESAVPYFSTGRRDDMAQRRFLEAQGAFWSDAVNNPVSSVYGGLMVDADRAYVYAYDARPFPDFPARSDVWGDAPNWETGHWLNGRLGRAPLDLLVKALAAEAGFDAIDTAALDGVVTGYLVDRPLSARETIDPLADVFQFDIVESDGALRCQPRHGAPVATFKAPTLAARDDGAFSLSLADENDLPAAFRLGFIDEGADFAAAVVEARDPGARPNRQAGIDIAAVIPANEAEARARSILADASVMREQLSFSLPPSALAVEPGDTVVFADLGADRRYRVTEIEDGATREVSLTRVSPSVYEAPVGPSVFLPAPAVSVFAAPAWELFELPLIGEADPAAPYLAAFADPWPGAVALYRGRGAATPQLSGLASARAVMGRLASALPPASSGRWDERSIDVGLSFGTLSSRSAEEVFAGANLFAVASATGAWEVAQFREAALQPDGTWRLSGLLRGQAGSEAEAMVGAPAGARFILMTRAVTQAAFPVDLRDLALDWQAGPETEIPDTENFTNKTLQFSARGLKPLSPVRLRARRNGGDILFSWVRRTRIGGDTWEGEVPLGEQSERYILRIFDGETVIREAETTAPGYVYAAADIASDFGPQGPGGTVAFSVAQISDAVGEGAAKKESIDLQ
ncbi:MAG: glycoside hydrolase/phage tail family protein [Pseudomonadota bacterium]